jgi:hypothetical protein
MSKITEVGEDTVLGVMSIKTLIALAIGLSIAIAYDITICNRRD